MIIKLNESSIGTSNTSDKEDDMLAVARNMKEAGEMLVRTADTIIRTIAKKEQTNGSSLSAIKDMSGLINNLWVPAPAKKLVKSFCKQMIAAEQKKLHERHKAELQELNEYMPVRKYEKSQE